ncbi:MAG: RIP metalloprotease RseP [Lachnospiraceae bacterium]|nr:RIP metalloprotease RseP [Lachnospiraceae bacterium]
MNILIALIIFSVIVLFHEFGHFLFAKLNGIGVIEFSLGMGPRIITYAKVNGKSKLIFFCSSKRFEEEKWEEVTKYSWKILPLGGSCAMVGEDTDSDAPNAFNKKGVWARFQVVFAGPFFNLILAFIFSIIIIFNTGVDLPKVAYVVENQPAYNAGIKEGDLIKKINKTNIHIGREVSTYFSINNVGDSVDVVVERDGKLKTFEVDPNYERYVFGINYTDSETSPAKISQVVEGSAADKAGIKDGDIVKSINDIEVKSGSGIRETLDKINSQGEETTFVVERNGKEKTLEVTPKKEKSKTLGLLATSNTKVGILKNIGYSAYEVKYWVVTTVGSLKQLIMGKVSLNDMSGPVGIVDMVGDSVEESKSYGIKTVLLNILYMAVLLSANLGVMNLLPIPALDGGRLVFIIIEAIRRKPIDPDKEGYVHFGGFVALMILMVVIMFNDIMKIIR